MSRPREEHEGDVEGEAKRQRVEENAGNHEVVQQLAEAHPPEHAPPAPPLEVSLEMIVALVAEREKARAAKNWGVADQLRTQIIAMGVDLQDKERVWRTTDGQTGSYDPHRATEPRPEMMPVENLRQLLEERSLRRKEHDWARADAIRDELRAGGVDVHDKEGLWKGPDGSMGLIPNEVDAKAIVPEATIYQLLEARDTARRGKDFDTADRLREELKRGGIELFDKNNLWKDTRHGRQGPLKGPRGPPMMMHGGPQPPFPGAFPPYDNRAAMHLTPMGQPPMPQYGAPQPPGALSESDIAREVAQREWFRANKDYQQADAVRTYLRSAGVEVDDKGRRWSTSDGAGGVIPTYAEAAALLEHPPPYAAGYAAMGAGAPPLPAGPPPPAQFAAHAAQPGYNPYPQY